MWMMVEWILKVLMQKYWVFIVMFENGLKGDGQMVSSTVLRELGGKRNPYQINLWG